MTKFRFFSFLLGFILALSTLALGKDSINAVTMVSYEQGPHDYTGTLSLRNNTNEEIHNIAFIITYLDMSGNDMDYEEFSLNVQIASGMTKKIDIPAYEYNRHYRYYKTEKQYGSLYPNTFKIKFVLKGYNNHSDTPVQRQEYDLANDNSEFSETNYLHIAGGIIIAVLTLAFCIGIYALVGVMARRRNRDVALWVVLSFILSPILIIIILLCVGKVTKHEKEY